MQVQSLEEARRLLSEFQSLIKSPAWGRLVEEWREQIDGRDETIHEPLSPHDLPCGHEFMKGEVAFGYTVIGYPEMIVEHLKTTIAELTRDEEIST